MGVFCTRLCGWINQQTCVSIGSCSRRIIGWQLADNMKVELVIAAFKKTYWGRSAQQRWTIHSDRGGQYASNTFRKLFADKKAIQSRSRADNPYVNAFMEPEF
jgi:putative transposase